MRFASYFNLTCIGIATYCISQWGYHEFACWILGLSYGWSATSFWNKETQAIKELSWRNP